MKIYQELHIEFWTGGCVAAGMSINSVPDIKAPGETLHLVGDIRGPATFR